MRWVCPAPSSIAIFVPPNPSLRIRLRGRAFSKWALEWSCYGYRRVTHELSRQGITTNRRLVATTNRRLVATTNRRLVATTNSGHRLPVYPNLAAGMDIPTPDQPWVSDLTYIRLGHDFVYLAVVLDACSRRCLGWSLGRRLGAALATSALRMALNPDPLTERKPQVHHSDRGAQYASGEYTNLLKESGVHISMSRKGSPYDNAKAESFMKTQIGHFLEAVYNQKRLHSSLAYLPPAEYERLHKKDRDKNQTITP